MAVMPQHGGTAAREGRQTTGKAVSIDVMGFTPVTAHFFPNLGI